MMESSSGWHSQDPTLSVASQEDFQQFLDMGINGLGDSLQFDFQDFSQQQGHGTEAMQQDEGNSMASKFGNRRGGVKQDIHMPPITSASNHDTISGSSAIQGHTSSGDIAELDAQIQYLQQQRQQQQQRQSLEQQQNYYAHHRVIPPTPNSIEMYPSNAQYYPNSDPQHAAMYERYRVQREQEQMAFTPLASPAVTPLDTHFNIPEYTVPGAYFSPLSSPALHAQNDQSSGSGHRHPAVVSSPIDMNLGTQSAPGSSVILPRKSGRKATQKPRATQGVRQSPIVKLRKARRSLSTTISTPILGDIRESAQAQNIRAKNTNSSQSTASTEGSENGSISPEHLSDMAPPPVPPPGSIGKSPSILAQKDNLQAKRLALGSPATPASLMKLTQSPSGIDSGINNDIDIDEIQIDNFDLPKASTSTRPPLSRIDTQPDGQATPTLRSTSARTSGFNSLPASAFTRSSAAPSASQSPQLDAMDGSNRKNPQIAPRGFKKRPSNSALVSPALLPRISPGIKPLLPGGGKVSDDTASLLLASKSNYQNILEGNHLPGVSYPTELSTNLTSKRTSHKIAEQGRRNRINSALQEIAKLLPRGAVKDCAGDKSGSGEAENENAGLKGAQNSNSKVSTVEMAIEYIKQLQDEVAEATKRAEAAEKELEERS